VVEEAAVAQVVADALDALGTSRQEPRRSLAEADVTVLGAGVVGAVGAAAGDGATRGAVTPTVASRFPTRPTSPVRTRQASPRTTRLCTSGTTKL
jgi:hypothetical protein